MGNSSSQHRGISLDCCVRKTNGRALCDVHGSIFGEDAFYRDAFYDCDEGDRSHDRMFQTAREQARLKMNKTSLLAGYVRYVVTGTKSSANLGDEMKPLLSDKGSGSAKLSPRGQLQNQDMRKKWLGRTIPEWGASGLPATGDGPFWRKGMGDGLKVRCGPDYRKKRSKEVSQHHAMYEAISCDAVRSDEKVQDVIHGYLEGRIPAQPEQPDGDRGGGGCPVWTPDCPLPRIICINMMMPYTTGVVPYRKDAGCSFVGFFHITAETIREAKSENPRPAVKLFKKFWEGPAAAPGDAESTPDRSLFQRVDRSVKKDEQSGLFKAIAKCVNPEDVNVPEICQKYNGQPCLITRCGYVIKDPNREWLELGIDVRGFNFLARRMLCSLRDMLPRTKIHYGFLIQGVEDEELPEGLVCDMFCCGINMLDDPVALSPNPTPGHPTQGLASDREG